MSAPRGSEHRGQEVRAWQAGTGKGAAVVGDAARGALCGGPAEDPTFGDPLAPCWAQQEPGLSVSGTAGARGQAAQVEGQNRVAGECPGHALGIFTRPHRRLPSGVRPSLHPDRACLGLGGGRWARAGEPPTRPPQRPRRPRCFRPVLAHVQLLWELMLLGEPLLVLAPSPAVSSEMVLALTRWVGRQREGPGALDQPCELTVPAGPSPQLPAAPQVLLRLPPLLHRPR